MPYITKQDRARLSHAGCPPMTAGELNYLLTVAAIDAVHKAGGRSYAVLNDIVAAFDDAAFSATPHSDLGKKFREITNDFVANMIGRYTGEVVLLQMQGALRCAQLEFYRRVVAPYEDEKIALNGDVYPS